MLSIWYPPLHHPFTSYGISYVCYTPLPLQFCSFSKKATIKLDISKSIWNFKGCNWWFGHILKSWVLILINFIYKVCSVQIFDCNKNQNQVAVYLFIYYFYFGKNKLNAQQWHCNILLGLIQRDADKTA